LASVAAFLCLMFAHLLWPAMVVLSRARSHYGYNQVEL